MLRTCLRHFESDTCNLKCIFISHDDKERMKNFFVNRVRSDELKLLPLKKDQFVKMLRRLLRKEGKDGVLNKSDKQLENHDIFEVMVQDLDTVRYVVSNISDHNTLDMLYTTLVGELNQ